MVNGVHGGNFMYIIYQITNKKTGDFYIGRTGRRLEARVGQHMQTAFTVKNPSLFQLHIIAFGIKAFNWESLHVCESYHYSVHLEDLYIKKMNPSYNKKAGHQGRLALDAAREISLKSKGREPWNAGRKNVYTEEHLKKFSNAKKGKPGTKWTKERRDVQIDGVKKYCRQVIEKNSGQIFYSVSEVSRALSISRSAVKMILNGSIKSPRKYNLEYINRLG